MMNKKEIVHGFGAVLAYISSRKISILEKFCVIGFVLAYIVSPVDLLPDTPVLGWFDDIGVVAFFVAFCNYRISNLKVAPGKKDVIDVIPFEVSFKDCDSKKSLKAETPFFFSTKNSKKKSLDDFK